MAFAVTTDPETLDPHMTSNGAAWTVFSKIHDSLFYQDLDLTFQGLLAESWEISDDSKEITLKLREGVKFQDGAEFNADAVKFTFERLADIGAKNPNFEMAKGITVEVVDPMTAKLVFDEPNAAFFNAFTGGYGAIRPRATRKKRGTTTRASRTGRAPTDSRSGRRAQRSPSRPIRTTRVSRTTTRTPAPRTFRN